MKKVILSFVLALSAICCFAEKNEKWFNVILDSMTYSTLFVTPDAVFFDDEESLEVSACRKDTFYLGDDGYYRINNEYYGNKIVVFANGGMSFFFRPEEKNNVNDEYYKNLIEQNIYHSTSFGVRYSSSSELTEKTKQGKITYSASNLGKVLLPPDSKESFPGWNYEQIPYAEGKKGYGEGVKIKITSEDSFNSLNILNGYVSLSDLSLYKANSRVKTFTVKDIENKVQYEATLEDAVMFQYIYFEKPTHNVELIIKDVYKGDKYADTCITGIIPSIKIPYSTEDKPFNYKKQKQDFKAEVSKELSEILKKRNRK